MFVKLAVITLITHYAFVQYCRHNDVRNKVSCQEIGTQVQMGYYFFTRLLLSLTTSVCHYFGAPLMLALIYQLDQYIYIYIHVYIYIYNIYIIYIYIYIYI